MQEHSSCLQIDVPYSDYLNSEHWSQVRNLRIKMDDNKCAICGCGDNLRVHHITYRRIGDEDLSDLITLCASCHEKVHSALDYINDRTGDLDKKTERCCKKVLLDGGFDRTVAQNLISAYAIKQGKIIATALEPFVGVCLPESRHRLIKLMTFDNLNARGAVRKILENIMHEYTLSKDGEKGTKQTHGQAMSEFRKLERNRT